MGIATFESVNKNRNIECLIHQNIVYILTLYWDDYYYKDITRLILTI